MLRNLPIKHYIEELMTLKAEGEKSLEDYLINFATEHFFEYKIDEFKISSEGESVNKTCHNIVIYKNTSPGTPPIALECGINVSNFNVNLGKFYRRPFLKLGDYYITSQKCEVGIALILQLLDSDISMNVEAIFTYGENSLMQGAEMFSDKLVHSKSMLCIGGNSQSGIFTSSPQKNVYILDIPKKRKYITQNVGAKTFLLEIPSQDFPGLYDFALSILEKISNIKIFNLEMSKNSCYCTFITTMDMHDLHGVIKQAYIKGKRINKHFKIKCTRLLDCDFILEKSDEILSILCEIKNLSGGSNVRYEIGEYYSSLGLLSINAYMMGSNDSYKVEQKKMTTFAQAHHVKIFLDRVYPAFKTLDGSMFAEKFLKICDEKFLTQPKVYGNALEGGFFQKRKGDLDVICVCTETLETIRNGEMIHISSLRDISMLLQKFFTEIK